MLAKCVNYHQATKQLSNANDFEKFSTFDYQTTFIRLSYDFQPEKLHTSPLFMQGIFYFYCGKIRYAALNNGVVVRLNKRFVRLLKILKIIVLPHKLGIVLLIKV